MGLPLARLLSTDHQVCVLDNLRSGGERLEGSGLSVALETADIRHGGEVRDVVTGFDPGVIIHLAATHYIPDCERDPATAVATNVLGTVNALLACPVGTRFVFASSAAVYAPSDSPHNEDSSALGPDDVYGLSKLQGEQWVHHLASNRGFPAVVARLFNVLGPGETNPHVLPEIIAQLKAGRTHISVGNLAARRDYVDVEDAAAAFKALATCGDLTPGVVEVVNVGTGMTHSVAELITRLRPLVGTSFDVRVDRGRLRLVDRPALCADITKVARMFGWSPARDLGATLSRTWADPQLPASILAKYGESRPQVGGQGG